MNQLSPLNNYLKDIGKRLTNITIRKLWRSVIENKK